MSKENNHNVDGLLGPSVGYIDLLDAILIERDKEKQSKPPQYNPLRPSASGFCARLLAHNFAEYRGLIPHIPEEISPDLHRLFSLGHAVEYNMIRMFEQAEIFEIKYKQQAMTFMKISDTEIIEGSNDKVIYIPGHRCLADWKTKGDKWSSYYESKWNEIDEDLQRMKSVQMVNERVYWINDLDSFLDEVKDRHFASNFFQINLYLTHPFMVERKVDHGLVLMYDKNKSRLREIRFRPSQKAKDYVLNKFSSIVEAVDVQKNPDLIEKEHMLGSMMCAFCKRKNLCWPEADARKEFYSTLPPKKWPRDTDRLGSLGEELEDLYEQFKSAEDAAARSLPVEEKLCMTMNAANVKKVRFADGHVYELKFLKSPRPHYEFRRTKV